MGRAAGFTARARVSAAGGSGALQPLSDEQCKSVTMTFLLTVSELLPGAGEALLGVKGAARVLPRALWPSQAPADSASSILLFEFYH